MAISLSLSELAGRTDGKIICGEAGSLFTGMAALDAAGPDDISFLGNEKYIHDFHSTKAGAVIVPQGHTFKTDGPALVSVPNPTLAFSEVIAHFAAALEKFSPGIHPDASISPKAAIDPSKVCVHSGAVVMENSDIGEGTEISPNAVIYRNVKIGKDCRIGANVSIREGCVLGDRVIIHPGAVIGADGYGYQFIDGRHHKIPQVGIVEIGDDVEIGANTTIDRARFGKTVIGEGSKLDNLVQIGHNCVVGKHCLIVSQSGIAGSTKIGDYVTIAAQVGITGHITIGDKATVTARSGVTTSLAGGIIYSGKPAAPMRENMKIQAHVRRLPKLLERVKALEKQVNG